MDSDLSALGHVLFPSSSRATIPNKFPTPTKKRPHPHDHEIPDETIEVYEEQSKISDDKYFVLGNSIS